MIKMIIRSIIIMVLAYGPATAMAQGQSFDEVLSRAQQGDANAQNAAGLAYIKQDNAKEAFSWFKKGADQGDPASLYDLGLMYFRGKFVPKDTEKAKTLFQKAAEAGSPKAQYMVGIMYRSGELGGKTNPAESVKWIKLAAEKNFPPAQNLLGIYYNTGFGVAKDPKEGHAWFEKAADKGLLSAWNNLGDDYLFGRGVAKDKATALSWYNKGAERNSADAQMRLATVYFQDGKSEQNGYWLKKAAANGNNTAKKILYAMSAQDDVAAVTAKSANPEMTPFTVPADYKIKAAATQNNEQEIADYTKRAEAGDADAMFELGRLYVQTARAKQGLPWIRKAAAQGQPEAMDLLENDKNYNGQALIDRLNTQLKRAPKQQRIQSLYRIAIVPVGPIYRIGNGNTEALEAIEGIRQ